MTEPPLSVLQQLLLGVLYHVGECSPSELSRHTRVDSNRLGAPLRGLELRGLIGRTYSTHMAMRDGGHAYVVTSEGVTTARVLSPDVDE